jgi:type I restriction enzyme S subunit
MIINYKKNIPKLRFPNFSEKISIKKLKEITYFVDYRGRAPQKTTEGVFLVTAKNIRRGYIDYNRSKEYVSVEKYDEVMSKGKPKLGDVLFTTEAPMGNVAQVDNENIALAQRVIKFRSKEIMTNKFLKYYFLTQKFQSEILRRAIGTTVKGISGKELHNIRVSFPTISEQQKISSFLTSVDSWIENLKQQKEKYEEYKKEMMQKIFSQEIRFKDNNSKDFPKWKNEKLGNVGDLKNGYAFKSSNYKKGGKYKIITIGNVKNGLLSVEKTNQILELPGDIMNHQILDKGDILISMTGNVGRICLVDQEDCLLNQRVGKIVLEKEKVYKDFIFQRLNSKNFEFRMRSLGQGGAQDNISKGDILIYKFMLPSLSEQKKIAEFLSSIDKLVESKNKQITKAEEWKKGLMQQLFI